MNINQSLNQLFTVPVHKEQDVYILNEESSSENQNQTNGVFSEKWRKFDSTGDLKQLRKFQLDLYLKHYGFESESDLGDFLRQRKIIVDAGCGPGFKAAWFAELAPQSLVLGIDYSNSVFRAAEKYREIPNLIFAKGDVADTKLHRSSVDYISCDQVLHHTEDPEKTFKHLSDILSPGGEFACYVYARKALPRELLDDYFRNACKEYESDDIWQLADQLTILGKRLADLQVEIESPDIPALGIKGGKYDLQRFIYWNFLKCFWNDSVGYENSVLINYDWYAPGNAFRYSEETFKKMINENHLDILHFHKEEACYTGRFRK